MAPPHTHDIYLPGSRRGHLPSGIQEEDTFRVIGHNINRPENQKLVQGLTNFHLEQASAFLIQENNTDFKKLEVRYDWNNTVKHWPAHHSSHTTSTAKLHTGRYLPGGTTTSVVGKHSSCVINSGIDQSGMGRYSWILLQGKADRTVLLISVYRTCQNQNTGPFTVQTQQCHILCQTGNPTANPRKNAYKMS